MSNRFPRLKAIGASDHFLDRAEAHLRHELTQLLSNKSHEIHHMLWLTGKLSAQPRVLRGDASRAGIQVANPHHNATGRNERPSRKTKFLCAQQCGDHHIAPGLELTIRLHRDARAEIIQHERLVRFR